MRHTKYDDEIRAVEARLVHEREALVHRAEDLTQTAKRMAASPKGLIGAAVAGFIIGELTRPKRSRGRKEQPAPGNRLGMGGILGGVALALIRAQFGSPLGLGRAALDYARSRRERTRDEFVKETGVPEGESGWGVAPPPEALASQYAPKREMPSS